MHAAICLDLKKKGFEIRRYSRVIAQGSDTILLNTMSVIVTKVFIMYINKLQLLYTVIENILYEFYSVKFQINQCDFFSLLYS